MSALSKSSTHPEPKRRGRQRSLTAQSAILAATCELLEKKCLCDVTVEAIAQRSGVSKATIYKWWPNKLLVALDAFLMRMTKDVPIPDTGSAQKDFTEQLKSSIKFYVSPAGRLFCQFIAEGQSDPDFLALFRERCLRARRNDLRIMWERGVARGEVRKNIDVEVVLDLIYGPMIYRLLAGHGPLNNAQAEAIVSTLFCGLKNDRKVLAAKKRHAES
jgi:AcrR family transcriptional regulator